MEIHLAFHPDWPHPMSNAPEPPPEPGPGMSRPILPATDRHNRGRAHLGHVVNYWLARSNLSTRQLSRIADWGLDERGWLHDAKLSQIRRNMFIRALPMRYLDALGAANEAIWLWQCRGEAAAVSKLGPPPKDRVDPEWLTSAIWLPHPEFPTEPLSPADWFDLACGHLELPCVSSPILSPNEGPLITAEIRALLLSLVATESSRDQVRHLLRVYPVTDQERKDRLTSVLIGAVSYSKEQAEQELYALAEVVRALRGLTSLQYGPAELYSELSQDRRQVGGGPGDD